MQDRHEFQFSETEAKRMRRGAYLFPLLVLPFAAIFAFDSSKSQPTHFILVMSIAVLVGTIFVAISRAGANAQIQYARSTSLIILPDRLVWKSSIGQSELLMAEIIRVTAKRRRSRVSAITLKLSNSASTTVQGYERMDEVHQILKRTLPSSAFD